MARISGLTSFNEDRQRLVNINKGKDDALLLTADEVKSIVKSFIKDELNYFAVDITKERTKELETLIIAKLGDIEGKLTTYVNNKVAIVAERIYQSVISSEFESLVKIAVTKKIEQIKKEIIKNL